MGIHVRRAELCIASWITTRYKSQKSALPPFVGWYGGNNRSLTSCQPHLHGVLPCKVEWAVSEMVK